jgi:hypothetical protein
MKYCILVFAVFLFGCDSENASDCFQPAGDPITKEFFVGNFQSIDVSQGIDLIIKQGDVTKVEVQTGSNLIDEISVWVENGELFLRNSNGCNWVRDYNDTKIYVTTPQLVKVYSSSQFSVISDGVLSFPNLTLQSAMFSKTASGTFDIEVAAEVLTVQDNASSFFRLRGTTGDLTVAFYDGNARFDGSDLTAQTAHVFQRSSNDMIIKAMESIDGTIYSTGNVVLKNTPNTILVTQLYTGHLVYP